MKKILLSIVAVCHFFSADCAKLKITCRSKGMELTLLKEAINDWIKTTGGQHEVEIVTLPHASNECFALYQQWLSAESFDVDVLLVDYVWVGIFSNYLVDLSEAYEPGEIDEIDIDDCFDSVVASIYSDGKLLALPMYTDAGVIFYRQDLLNKYDRSVPTTWEELYETAKYVQNEERKDPEKKNKFYGFVFQAKAFEILTCNFLEFVDSFGGAIVKDGEAAVNSEAAVDATMFIIKCLNNITNKSVLNYSEEDARGAFQSGNAVFMRSWPYSWALLNDPSTVVAGKVGVMAIPPRAKEGKPSGSSGGWCMAISKYSKNKKVAASLIKFLTSKNQQRLRAKYSYSPTYKSLYKDREVLKSCPFLAQIYDSLENAVARPSADFGKNYPRASSEIYNVVNGILTNSIEDDNMTEAHVKKLLDRLNKKLNSLLKKTNGETKPEKEEGESFWTKIKKFLGFEDEAGTDKKEG
ncbi:MAG: ABC transporter substrate-binding protein [Holosporaceae bacterium]|jgi:trehalose/maltose transport system substrate-binding protein|nr:ABC transporter substrate-binding protein [Holosporaceae bacterium]